MSENNIDDLFNNMAGKVLKKYREEKKLSLEELAKKMKIDITRQSLFKYENGKARIKNSIFIDICQALNLNPNDILNEITMLTFNEQFNNILFDDKEKFKNYNYKFFSDNSIKDNKISEYFETNPEEFKKIRNEIVHFYGKYKMLSQEDKELIKNIIDTRIEQKEKDNKKS